MRGRLVALLLALVAVLSLTPAAPAAADDDSPTGPGVIVDITCSVGGGDIIGGLLGKDDLCDKVGQKVNKVVNKAWEKVWDSVFGDVIRSGRDAARWVLKKSLTVALMGPSLNLEDTGLFGRDATLAGMLVWLGWVIAAFGLMWQLGKMAVTGQMKYAGQALVGWVQNALLTGIGLTIVAVLLRLGDAMSSGLVDKTFGDDGQAVERIVATLLPKAISNPMIVLGVVATLILVGFANMIMIFLRQSAIPIQCLLLPIAGAGRVGGESTRQWAPRLITSICVVIAYKPLVAIIICIGFAEFGHSKTLAEWLRGVVTLILALVAPGPLVKLFAPLGAEAGAGLAAGGALGAAASVGSYVGSRGGDDGPSGGGVEPVSAVKHAQHVAQTMADSSSSSSEPGGGGGDTLSQASRTQAVAAQGPNQAGGRDGAAPGDQAETGATTGTGSGTAGASVGAGATGSGTPGIPGARSASPGGLTIEVLDGVSNTVDRASSEIGDGGSTRDHS